MPIAFLELLVRPKYIYYATRNYTLKKKGTLPNPPKRFGRFEKACKCVESSKKRIKKSTKPIKDLPVYPGEDPFFLETFLSSVEQKKVL